MHHPVEAAGTAKGRVHPLRMVGGGNDKDRRVGVEALHLLQHRVDDLGLVLPVGAREIFAATKAVDLVEKENGWRVAARLGEGSADGADVITQMAGRLPAGNARSDEAHTAIARDCAGECRLARTRRTG